MNIWVPRTKIIEPKRELLTVSPVKGFFRLQVRRPDGRVRVDTGFFPNLILDQGLDLIGTSSSWMNCVRVGTGSTAPATGQTNLAAHLAGTSTNTANNSGAQSSPPYYGFYQRTWRFSQGAAAGNLTEIGVGTATTNGSNLFSRALILDGSLSPTTLTVLSDEFLDVTYELRAYPPTVDGAGTITLDGNNYDFVSRASQVTTSGTWSPTPFNGGHGSTNSSAALDGAIGTITGSPSGTQAVTTPSNASYSASSYQRDFTATWALGEANFVGGIESFRILMACGQMQYGMTPAIPKVNTQTLAMTFRHTWARH